MKIGLIGAGRLGICLALLIEQEGYHVIASDVREDYINDLQNKKINSTAPPKRRRVVAMGKTSTTAVILASIITIFFA